MKRHQHIFLGVKTNDMDRAKQVCEALIEHVLKCTNSTFYGGDHCHTSLDDSYYELRLNHHDDGDGWSWCVDDPRYPLVFSCSFKTPAARDRVLGRVQQFELIEVPRNR